MDGNAEALTWQIGIWDRAAAFYHDEIDRRFEPVVAALIRRAAPRPGERVLDLGTGTGAVALAVTPLVAPHGQVLGIDVSPRMLALARHLAVERGLSTLTLLEESAEELPVESGSIDLVLASLSLM